MDYVVINFGVDSSSADAQTQMPLVTLPTARLRSAWINKVTLSYLS